MIADRYLQLKSELENGLAGLIKLGSEMQRPSEQLDTLQALLREIGDPLLFVIVGEVKSGKSSLLNALFGNQFAKVDVLPATDRVYIFRYGAEEKTSEVSPTVTERYLPIPLLRDVNVVDTPGTNTIVKEHQTMTEEFMPRADIVLFVFSVTNPWTQSNWEFLKFLQKTWLKNVIFVLQQIDLREPAEIDIIHRHLQDTAMRQLGFVPPIFAVSARKALLARTSGVDKDQLWEESAFGPLEEQINFIVTESSTRMLKLRSTFQSARATLDDLARDIATSLEKIVVDETALRRLDDLLETRREQLRRQISGLVRDIENAYDETAEERNKLLYENVTAGSSFRLIFGRTAHMQATVADKLRQLMKPDLDKAVNSLETDLRGVWPQMQDLLEHQLSADLRKQARPTIPDFAGQRRELSEAIQNAFIDILAGKSLQERLARSSSRTAITMRLLSATIIVAGAVAILSTGRNLNVSIVAGAVAAVALIVLIVSAIVHRRKILRDYEEELNPRRTEFKNALDQQFGRAIDSFCGEMAKRFQNLKDICQRERSRYEPRQQRSDELQTRFAGLKSRLG